MLQTVLGVDAATIASAFLVAPATMSQRLVRAKSKIKEAGIPFRVPAHAELRERLAAVLEAIYAAFAEGWTDPGGTDSRRRDLADEAIWLGRVVVGLLPDEPEALGLLALMLHAEARRAARRTADGAYVPLAEQDPATWDARAIAEAEELLRRAGTLDAIGRYQLEAAVQSAHAVRRPDRPRGLVRDRAALRRDRRPHRLAGRGGEPRGRGRRVSRRGRRSRGARRARGRPAARDPPALLGRARRAAREHGALAAADAAYERAIGLERDPAVRTFLQTRRARCARLTRAPTSPSPPTSDNQRPCRRRRSRRTSTSRS
jgi:RNA polymerase sigma-70 factor (ECF subfamily)